MVSTPGINSGGTPGSDDGDDRTVEIRRRPDPSAATQRAQFAPGGVAPPARPPRGSAPDAPRTRNVRIGMPTAVAAATAAMSDTEYFARRRYEPAGLDHLAAVAGGPSARQRLRSLDATWTHYDHSSVDRLQRAVNQLREAQPANEDARARTVTALLQLYEPLTQWGFSEVDLLDIVGWLARNDPSRGAALRILHANREWLEQRDYQPSDVQVLAERPDFVDIVVALRLNHDQLRAAGFTSCQIAEAARNEAGARSIAALAEHHAQLQQIRYTPSQLSRYADIYGPDLIGLLAGRWQLTMQSGGPLGMAALISAADDGQPGHLVETLRERAETLPPEPAHDKASPPPPATPASDEAAEILERLDCSPTALSRLAAATGGPAAFTTLNNLYRSWRNTAPGSASRLLGVIALHEDEPGTVSDVRAEALVALVECHARLTEWGCTNAEQLSIVNWFDESDPGRADALRLLRDNSEWLAQKGYEPEQMCTLAERSDFVQIMQALREYDEPLRQAGLDSMHIAGAADAGADAIAALAGRSAAEA